MEIIIWDVNRLDNRFYDHVIAEMQPAMEEFGLVRRDDGSFRGENKAFRVEYSEPRQMFLLFSADVEDGVVGEYNEISSWLFDDSQNARDAVAVGVDFSGTVRDTLGIKPKRATVSAVDLPAADKNGALTVSGFAKKVLDVFPQYKDAYKAHVAQYGNFLYLNFYADTLVPQIGAVLLENNKKQVKKLFDLLELGYLQGDRETVNAVVAVTAAAACRDESLKEPVLKMLEGDKHFQNSVSAFIPVLTHRRGLRNTLVKS